MEFEKQILDFLANHNDGEYRSALILFADFIVMPNRNLD